MATGEVRGVANDPRSEDEPAYDGAPGRTRLEPIHVPLPNGYVRTVQVVRVVNVTTDPHLREPALEGSLHRFESGEHLAIPFVYHDPARRKLVLVVPEVLRHEELRLRAKLLTELAEHPEAPIPTYVAEANTVVGVGALAAFLERPAGAGLAAVVELEAKVEARHRDVEIQADAITQRERRLETRAEEVTRREDELRTWAEELEAQQADVGIREQELESRFEALRQREVAQKADSVSASIAVAAAREDDVVQLVDDEVEELDELEPLATSPGRVAGSDLADAVELLGEGTSPRVLPGAAPTAVASAADVEDDEEVEDVDAVHEVDDVEELEELEPIGEVTGVHADAAPASAPTPTGPAPSVAPPPGFLERRGSPEAHAVTESGGVRIFVRLPDAALFRATPPELLAQLVIVDERPIVLLSLVEADAARPSVLRAALDPRQADDRAVLENLRRQFAARLTLFGPDGAYLDAVDVEAPREVNVARILERVSKLRGASVDVATAMERVLASPPPVRSDEHPFVEAIPTPARAADAAQMLDRLFTWSSHDEMDRALLVLSIPRDRVDGAIRTILEHALGFGLPLPGRLQERAVSLGLAPDGTALISRQIEAFAQTERLRDHGGLSAEQRATAWESLLKIAADHEFAIDGDTHELAWSAIRSVRGGDGLGSVDPTKLPSMGVPELVLLLEHPRYRKAAAIELARREDPALAETIGKAIRKMPRAEVVRVAPRLVALGEDAGDALIDGLSARKTFVRQAFALCLGQLKLRRAVVPLLHLLTAEESEVWREVSRVLGSFGTASLRTVTRQLGDAKGKRERFVMTLAHLAHHGCAKSIEKLTQDERPAVAAMAVEALTLRDRARALDQQLSGGAPLLENDPISKFSRRFYEELAGNAPEQDLEEG